MGHSKALLLQSFMFEDLKALQGHRKPTIFIVLAFQVRVVYIVAQDGVTSTPR